MAQSTRDDPFDVTVAILTLDGGAELKRLLESVRGQKTGRRVEVLAIDSGSTDGSLEVLESLGDRVIEIEANEFNFGRTRDLAYENAGGAVVVNLSQDAVPAHDLWLENLLEPLNDPKVGVSCGASVFDGERRAGQFAWERNGYFYFTREIRTFVRRYGKGVSFANSAVPRRVWEKLRFDPLPLGEDFQFQQKLQGEGLSAAFPENAEVLHHHDYTLGSLYRRCHDEGLALRLLGCPYSEWDLAVDLASYRKYIQWLRELRRGSLRTTAGIVFPVLRPLAVYLGSRFGKFEPKES